VILALALDRHLGGVSSLFFLEKIPAVKLNTSINFTKQDTSQKMTLKSGVNGLYIHVAVHISKWLAASG
jgi:hypothetical protein